MNIVKCRDLVKTFPGQERAVLDGVSLEFETGCFVSIMGRSGSGKSTLLRCLCGLLPMDSGTVEVAGHDIAAMTAKQQSDFRSGVIGIVFQDNNLVDEFNVEDNILTPIFIAGARVDREYYARLLKLTQLEKFKDRFPRQLSGGQRQKVAIARALIAKPNIIFADEPTGSLDSKSELEIMDLFKTVNKEFGTSIIQVTHSGICAAAGSRTIRINDGKIEGDELIRGRAKSK